MLIVLPYTGWSLPHIVARGLLIVGVVVAIMSIIFIILNEMRLRKIADKAYPSDGSDVEINGAARVLTRMHDKDLEVERANLRELRDLLVEIEGNFAPLVEQAGSEAIDSSILREIETSFAFVPQGISEAERARRDGVQIMGVLRSHHKGMEKVGKWTELIARLETCSSRVTDEQLTRYVHEYRVWLDSSSHYMLWGCYRQHDLKYQSYSANAKAGIEKSKWAISIFPHRRRVLGKINKRIKELLK